jgi:hypothetical protein
MPVAPRPIRTVPLPRVPEGLGPGDEVVIARPINPTPFNPPGRRGRVVSTSLYAPEARHGRPAEAPRLLVYLRVTDRPAYPDQVTPKWADELDLVTGDAS